jgi:hypothetical protein
MGRSHSLKKKINVGFDYQEIVEAEGVWDQGAEVNIWTEERWSDGRLEEIA